MREDDGGLRGLFRRNLRRIHWQRVAVGMRGAGIPDTNWCVDGIEGWIEFKQTDGWAVTLRPGQIGWMARRGRAGGRVLVAVRRRTDGGPRTGPADELWLLDGRAGAALRRAGLRGAPAGAVLATWPGGPSRWNWVEIGDVLCQDPEKPARRSR